VDKEVGGGWLIYQLPPSVVGEVGVYSLD